MLPSKRLSTPAPEKPKSDKSECIKYADVAFMKVGYIHILRTQKSHKCLCLLDDLKCRDHLMNRNNNFQYHLLSTF